MSISSSPLSSRATRRWRRHGRHGVPPRSEWIERRERYPINVRYLPECRDQPELLENDWRRRERHFRSRRHPIAGLGNRAASRFVAGEEETMEHSDPVSGMKDCNLPAMEADVLNSSGLPGGCLSIELTETVMMESAEATIRTLQQLKNLGVKISADDFGTGYSSLSYLKRLPIDTLKIDQSFVRDIPADTDGASIAILIITMAHNLKLSVVAEGVETAEQMSFLKSKSCDLMQGYLVSRPMELRDTVEFLKKARNR